MASVSANDSWRTNLAAINAAPALKVKAMGKCTTIGCQPGKTLTVPSAEVVHATNRSCPPIPHPDRIAAAS